MKLLNLNPYKKYGSADTTPDGNDYGFGSGSGSGSGSASLSRYLYDDDDIFGSDFPISNSGLLARYRHVDDHAFRTPVVFRSGRPREYDTVDDYIFSDNKWPFILARVSVWVSLCACMISFICLFLYL